MITLDAERGVLDIAVDPSVFAARPTAAYAQQAYGMGRELFQGFRDRVGSAEAGAATFF